MSGTTGNYTLQLIHASDLEAALLATSRAPNFAALVDRFVAQNANTLTVISGDAWIPGPFYAAEGDSTVTPALRASLTASGVMGAATANPLSTRATAAFMDAIGTNVASFGNHEFDGGTGPINDALGVANFPYLSTNYDFTADPNLRSRVTADGQEASTIKGRIAGSTVVTIGGERIGVVGDTTQVLNQLTSLGAVTGKTPYVDDMDALAKLVQPQIDALLARGINKVVLTSHLQQYQLEQQLVTKLSGVDIVVSGGSHELFADSTDVIRAGSRIASDYPTILKDKDGNSVLQVNEENEYTYVGRLVVQFDAQGRIIPSSVDRNVSGSYATTDAVVQAAYAGSGTVPFAAGSRGAQVQALFGAVGNVINVKDGNLQGYTNVYLDGNRVTVRQQESNLGDLTADANLFVARQVDPTVAVSIKNGGGIRDVIGAFTSDPANPKPIPPLANPSANKPAGGVTQLDIENSLRFNNNLSLVTITAQQLKQVMEFGATLIQPGQTPGGFVQVGGLLVSYDTKQTAQVVDGKGVPTTVGQRVRNLAIPNDDGSIRDVIVADGQVVGNPARAIRVVTLDFIATSTAGAGTLGGDGNPIAAYATNRVDLLNNPALGTGLSTFAAPGSEQDATAEYFKARFGTPAAAFNTAETGTASDQRIEDLSARTDAVLAGGSVSLVTAGLSARSAGLVGGRLGANALVLSARDSATLGAPVSGRANVARFTPTAAGTAYVMPAGFSGAALGGSAPATLFGQGSDYTLVDGSNRGTLVTTGNATAVAGQAGTTMFGGGGGTTLVGGDGDDVMVGGSGATTVFTGAGRNLVGLGSGGGTVLSESSTDTIVAGIGAALVGATQGATVFGREGALTFVGGSGSSTVVGGTGSSTVFGGTGGGLFGGGSAGRNVIVGGLGACTIFGGGDGDALYAGSGGAVIVAAAQGNATLTAAFGGGASVLYAGGGANLLAGGTGNDVLVAGRGQAILIGGAGADLFAVRNGQAGSQVVVADFNLAQGDRVLLRGYAGGAQAALAAATASGGSTLLTLSDGTRVTFQGVTGLTVSAFV
jgi:2',3'-cyclic-nucleotide 2'-phosphodiesterase (5'-nucleotidase family)